MARKLSQTMARALDAIRADGGKAYPEKGGWWRGVSGERLSIETDDYRGTSYVTTQTIYALFHRGFLSKMSHSSNGIHPAYRLNRLGGADNG